MQITLELPDEVAAAAQAKGLAVEVFVREIVDEKLDLQRRGLVRFGPGPYTPEQAGRNIRELSKGLTLGGIKIKDLINEGRKY
jgi:hypothetical protein